MGLFLVVALASMVRPMMIGYLFHQGYQIRAITRISSYIYLLLFLNLGLIFFALIRATVYLRLELKTLFQLQIAILRKMLSSPIYFFARYSTGDLVQRILIINSLRALFNTHQLGLLFSCLSLLISFSVMFYFNWQLTLAVFMFSGLLTGLALWSSLRLLPDLEQHVDDMSHAYGFLFQVVNGISRIKLFARHKELIDCWDKRYSYSRQQLQKTYDKGVLGYALFSSFPTLLLLIIFYLGSVLGGSLEFKNFIIFFCGLCLLVSSMTAFYFVIGSVMLDSLIAYKRVRPLLDAPLEFLSTNQQQMQQIEVIERITFHDVHFAYPHSSLSILAGINVTMFKGQHSAFVGLSGSGKSTVLKLLLGFYLPQQGEIELNGSLLSGIDLLTWRAQIGLVLQDEQLFNGTIVENIIGYSAAQEDDVWPILNQLGIASAIAALPMGIHTVVSSSQNLLSGGQKQLVLIARALVGKPQLLILDEATNSLDHLMQEQIMRTVNQLTLTRITIAHRLSTVRHVDRIFVLNKGLIEQTGTYQQLVQQEGLFSQLAKSQGLI